MSDNFVRGSVRLYIPGKPELQYDITISQLEFDDLLWVPPEPPPFDAYGYSITKWQERLKRSNDACEMLGRNIARAFREAFQKDALK